MEPGPLLARQLQRIRELDQQIRHYADLEQRMLPWEDFVAILGQTGDAGGPQDIYAAVQQGLEAKTRDPANPPLLSLYQSGLLQAGDYIFRHLESTADIPPRAFGVIEILQPQVIVLLGRDNEFLTDPHHPMRRLCNILLQVCRMFDAQSGSRAENLLLTLYDLTETINLAAPGGGQTLDDNIDQIADAFDRHNAETVDLARELITEEQGSCRQENARQHVNRAILEAVEGLRLPLVFIQFLEQVWAKYLYITHLRQGVNSREWMTALRAIRQLADSLYIRGRTQMFHFHGTQVTPALRVLQEATRSIHPDEQLVRRFLLELDAIHQQVLNEQFVETGDWFEVRSTRSVDAPTGPATPPPAIKTLLVGHWYKWTDNGQERRNKLIEINHGFGYCLFTNLSGIRSARLSFEDAERLLARSQLQRMESMAAFDQALSHCVRELEQQLPALEQQADEAKRIWQDAQRRQQEKAAAERLRQQQEQQRQEEEAKRLEQRRREEDQRRAAKEARKRDKSEARQQLIDQALTTVAPMQPGGRVELLIKDKRVNCKLGLRLKSSGKLIFVDDLGRRLTDLTMEQLAERIVDGDAAILDPGVAFDSTMSTLINERSEIIHRNEPD